MPFNHQSSKSNKIFTALILLVISWYVLLCSVHYLKQRPLWNDEQCVLYSIERFAPGEMFTRKLEAIQVFPRLYLFLIQGIAQSFDLHILSLRLLPFICMLSAFFLWLKIAKLQLKNKIEYLVFVLSWTASVPLIYYSAELKQYSMDVLTGAVFLLFLHYHDEIKQKKDQRIYLSSLIGLSSLGMFSYTAFLFAGLLAFNLIILSWKDAGYRKYLMIYGAALICFLLLSYSVDMRLRHTGAVTAGFHDYFVSLESVGEFFKTAGEGANNLFSRWLVVRPRILKVMTINFLTFGFIYMFYGFFKNFKKDGYVLRSVDTVALAAFMQLFVLGVVKLYPFGLTRTALFFCPIALFLTIKGIGILQNINEYIYKVILGLYIAFLVFLSIGLTRVIFTEYLGFMPHLW